MVYIGVDLHRKVSQVAALTSSGELLWNRRIRSRPEEFVRTFGDLREPPAGVAFEATYGWGWFADLLAELGLPAHMSHPTATKAISAARVKNDASMPVRLRIGYAPTCCRRPGSVRRRLGKRDVSSAPERLWSASARGSNARCSSLSSWRCPSCPAPASRPICR